MNKDDIYYHYPPSLVGNESTLIKGNYGRIISASSDLKLREEPLESIRRQHFKDKPSRLKSIFLLKNLDDAIIYTHHRELKDRKSYVDVIV